MPGELVSCAAFLTIATRNELKFIPVETIPSLILEDIATVNALAS